MTMTSDSPSSLERQAEASRSRLSDTLDELRDRMTPGQLMDEVMTYAKGSGSSFLHSLGEAAKANPIPTLLIGAGCALLLNSGARSAMGAEGGDEMTRRMGQSNRRREPTSKVGVGLDERIMHAANHRASIGASASSAVDRIGSVTGESAENIADTVRTAARGLGEGVADTVRSAARNVREGSGATAQYVEDSAQYVEAQARWAGGRIQRGFSAMLEEQPLMVAAIGVALGAALGAILPATKTEDALVGETSDSLKDAVVDTVSEQYQRAKTAASDVVTDVTEEAGQQGLTVDNAANAARDLGQRVKSVVDRAVETMGGETAMSGAQANAPSGAPSMTPRGGQAVPQVPASGATPHSAPGSPDRPSNPPSGKVAPARAPAGSPVRRSST